MEEQQEPDNGEAAVPDGAAAEGSAGAWDGPDAWGGAEQWSSREWGSNTWQRANGAALPDRSDAQDATDGQAAAGRGTEGALLGACRVRAGEGEDEVIEMEESEASWGAGGDVGGGTPSDSEGDEGDALSRSMPPVDEPPAHLPLHGMPRSPRGDDGAPDGAPPARLPVAGSALGRASPLELPAAPLPSRRASLPQLGSFVARCIAGGA